VSAVGGCILILLGHTASQEGSLLLLGSQYLSRCKPEVMAMLLVRKKQDDIGRA
jgi:hypothetical protein